MDKLLVAFAFFVFLGLGFAAEDPCPDPCINGKLYDAVYVGDGRCQVQDITPIKTCPCGCDSDNPYIGCLPCGSGQAEISEEPTPEPSPFPSCAEHLGTIYKVEGAPILARSGQVKTISEGDSYCLSDVIKTGSSERLFIRFTDGNIRFVGSNSVMKISPDIPQSNDFVTRLVGVGEHIVRDGASRLNYDTVCGGDARMRAGRIPDVECRDSVVYTPHSSVRYEFTSSYDVVTVFEGYVEATDTATGEYATINSGQQYSRNAGFPVDEASLYEVDAAEVPRSLYESEYEEGCCGGPALAILSALFFYSRKTGWGGAEQKKNLKEQCNY